MEHAGKESARCDRQLETLVPLHWHVDFFSADLCTCILRLYGWLRGPIYSFIRTIPVPLEVGLISLMVRVANNHEKEIAKSEPIAGPMLRPVPKNQLSDNVVGIERNLPVLTR
jgi:hypothetical protein